MSDRIKVDDVFKATGSLIVLTLGVLVCLLIIKMSLGFYHGTVSFWQGLHTPTTAAKQAEYDAADAAWAKDPTNPKVVAQHCLDKGGTPTFSSWDGKVTSCKGTDSKSVNIEVNQ